MKPSASLKTAFTAFAFSGLLLATPFGLAADAHDHHAHHGSATDGRSPIYLDAKEKAFLLAEMGQFLEVSRRILAASLDNDMAGVAEAARSVGLAAHRADFSNPESTVQSIRKKAPKEFFPLARATHEAFDEIAEIATNLQDKETVQRRLAENLGRCTACHSAYRIVEQP